MPEGIKTHKQLLRIRDAMVSENKVKDFGELLERVAAHFEFSDKTPLVTRNRILADIYTLAWGCHPITIDVWTFAESVAYMTTENKR
jgi:hypothetical protein